MANKKELILQLKQKKTKQKIAIITNIRVVTKRILEIMKQHIGQENSISKLNLFRQVYKTNPEELNELQEWFCWEMIKKSMHNCRKYTKCFIISKLKSVSEYSSKQQGIYHFWVANTLNDVKIYTDNLERNIKAMRAMEKKCERSVRNGWFNEDWVIKNG